MPALPYSKKRYYLSGIDWIIGLLNNYMCSATPAGNHSTLVIELEQAVPEDKLKNRLDIIYSSIPILSGKPARDLLNLAPYWKVPARTLKSYDFEVLKIDSDKIQDEKLVAILNRPFSSAKTYLAFILLHCETRNLLLMTFDHRILDARGAELFLNLLSDDEPTSTLADIKKTDSPHLKQWAEQFAAGRTVQRKLISLSKEGCFSPSEFNMRNLPKTADANLLPAFAHFSKKESAEILEISEKKAGFMMETPYLLAVTSLAFHRTANCVKSEKYFVPVPIDMRTKGEEAERTFFNHLSFMFFYFEITPDTTLESLICEIRKQLFMQIEEEFPEKMIKAARPVRIFPFRLLKWVMKLPFDGKMSSFIFSNVGASSLESGNLHGSGIRNIYHMPRIPTPPGIGIFFNKYNDQLNLTVTADKNALPSGFGTKLKEKICELILHS